MTSIYQIFYDEISKSNLDNSFIPYDNTNKTTDIFENAVIIDVFKNKRDVWENSDYVGVLSWRFKEKTGLSGEEVISRLGEKPVYLITAQDCFGRKSPVSEYGYETSKLLAKLCDENNLFPFKIYNYNNGDCINCSNYWVVKPDIFRDYVENYLIKVVEFLRTNRDAVEICSRLVRYRGQLYPVAVFFIEALFQIYVHYNNIEFDYIKTVKVVETDSDSSVNKEHIKNDIVKNTKKTVIKIPKVGTDGKVFYERIVKDNHNLIVPNSSDDLSEFNGNVFNYICNLLTITLDDNYPIIDKNSNKKSFLFEGRVLEHNEFIIRNTIKKLGDGWGHIIMCSNDNYQQIKSICDKISSEIEIIIYNGEFSRNSYNNMMLDINLWDKFDFDHILIYQTDTLIFKQFDNRYLDYDYLGAPWSPEHGEFIKSHLNKALYYGNGGLSLRRVETIRKILKNELNVPIDIFNLGMDKIPEDTFICSNLDKYTNNLSHNMCYEFSFESVFNDDTFGCHQPWVSIDYNKFEELVIKHFKIKSDKKTILFINHEESKTGAPAVLKNLLESEDICNLYNTYNISIKKGDWDIKNNVDPGPYKNLIEGIISPDLIFVNTIVSLKYSESFKSKKCIWIHEYKSIKPFIKSKDIYKLLELDKVFVICDNTKKILKECGIESHVLPYYLNLNKIDTLDNDKIDVVGIGYVHYRKGIDRFIEIANMCPNKKFVWVGKTNGVDITNNKISLIKQSHFFNSYDMNDDIKHDTITIDIPSNLTFIGEKDTSYILKNIIPNSDIMMMLSYDDPRPLVVVESKLLNKNVVTLKDSGDSYLDCDDNDLILDEYDKNVIVNYINNCKINNTRFRDDIMYKYRNNMIYIINELNKLINN